MHPTLTPEDVAAGRAVVVRCPECGQMEIWSEAEAYGEHGLCRHRGGPCPVCASPPYEGRVVLSVVPEAWGPEATAEDARRWTYRLADMIEAAFPTVEVDVDEQAHEDRYDIPDDDVQETVRTWVQDHFHKAIDDQAEELVEDPWLPIFVLRDHPEWVVVGFERHEPDPAFVWLNGEIGDLENPDELAAMLGDELFRVPARLGDELGEAWCVSKSRLPVLTGRQGDRDQPFRALARLAAEWLAREA